MRVEGFEFPDDLLYTKDMLWAKRLGGRRFRLGLTSLAAELYRGVIHISLPEVGETIGAGDPLLSFETIKAVASVEAPSRCKVLRVNEDVVESPEVIAEKPYELWLVEVELESEEGLMSIREAAQTFKQVIEEERKKYEALRRAGGKGEEL